MEKYWGETVKQVAYGTATVAELGLGLLAESSSSRGLLPTLLGDHSSNFLVTIPLVLAGYSLASSLQIQEAFIHDLPEQMQATAKKYQTEIFNTLKVFSLSAITMVAFYSEIAGMNINQLLSEGYNSSLLLHNILPDIAFGLIGIITATKFVDSMNRSAAT